MLFSVLINLLNYKYFSYTQSMTKTLRMLALGNSGLPVFTWSCQLTFSRLTHRNQFTVKSVTLCYGLLNRLHVLFWTLVISVSRKGKWSIVVLLLLSSLKTAITFLSCDFLWSYLHAVWPLPHIVTWKLWPWLRWPLLTKKKKKGRKMDKCLLWMYSF